MAREPKAMPALEGPVDHAGPADEAEGTAPPPPAPSKTAHLVVLLQRPEGATLVELMEATGWLAHTTRAALTGLRGKGHVIARGKRDDVTCYSIIETA